MSLALDYRPQDFNEVEGNESVVASVEALLSRDKGNIPHSWLFTGPSGCGKTTMARIIATKLGCQGSDFYEVDSADFRGIDTIRSIRQQMMYKPIESDCRVWLLDECHQLSKDGQEALLKALEDTPPHVYFILATTDPEKLKPTLRGRCVTHEMQPLGERGMVSFLKEISEAEEKEVPVDVLKKIAMNSMGSSRMALQLLEKVIDLDSQQMLDSVEKEVEKQNSVIELCRALIAAEKWKKVSTIVKNLEKEDVESIRLAVMGYCSSVLLNGDNPQAYLIMDSFKQPFFNNGRAGLILACYESLEATTESAPF